MLKVMTIVGTRPELIRLSRVIARLDETVDHVLVHTGQNYDYELNEIFFEDLGIRKPDHMLRIDTSSLGRVLGETLIRTEEVLRAERPDAVLVLGDTNSCISALMAKRMRIPVYHMEAGNRCFDENVPEETNRRLVDHVADFNLVYTDHARRNLLAEGLHPRRILMTGSPMNEVLRHYQPGFKASKATEKIGLRPGGFVLVSAHREENVDSPERFGLFLDCLQALQDKLGLQVFVSAHPRTRKRVDKSVRERLPRVTFHKPLGFQDYIRLQLDAFCVISDSGTIAEESAILGFPAITIRDSIERPEALDSGSMVMTGLNSEEVVRGVEIVRQMTSREVPTAYQVVNCAERVVNFIHSTASRHAEWAGLRRVPLD